MKEVFEVAFAIIISMGGGGAIIFALSSWLGKIWAQRIINKEELSNNYLLYSSQIQFEREYKIYSQIWLKMLDMKWATLAMMPILDYLPEDKTKIRDEYIKRYENHIGKLKDFYTELYSNAPFISESIYGDLIEIGKMCREQGIDFSVYKIEIDKDERNHSERKAYYDKDKKITEDIDNLTNKLREYLKKYKVESK